MNTDKFDMSGDKATLDLAQIERATTIAVGLAREAVHRTLESWYRLDRLASITEADFMLRDAERLHVVTRTAWFVKEARSRGEIVLVRPHECRYCLHLANASRNKKEYVGACELSLSPDTCNKFCFLDVIPQKTETHTKPACRYCEHLKPDPADEYGGMKCELGRKVQDCGSFVLDKECYEAVRA